MCSSQGMVLGYLDGLELHENFFLVKEDLVLEIECPIMIGQYPCLLHQNFSMLGHCFHCL